MANLEKDGLQAGSGVMLWVTLLHTLDHFLSVGGLFVITVCSYADNPPYQMDDNLCFLPVWVCVGGFWGVGK